MVSKANSPAITRRPTAASRRRELEAPTEVEGEHAEGLPGAVGGYCIDGTREVAQAASQIGADEPRPLR